MTPELVKANRRQLNDIDPSDLTKTLEAHRQSNRKSLRLMDTDKSHGQSKQGDSFRLRLRKTKRDKVRELFKELGVNSSDIVNTLPETRPSTGVQVHKDSLLFGTVGDQSDTKQALEYEGNYIQPLVRHKVCIGELPWTHNLPLNDPWATSV
jgi:hypothetical protein